MSEALFQPFPLATAARAQIWHHAPATRRPRHFHVEPELNVVTAGHATFGMGDKVLAVEAGDLLWWPPGQDHVLLEASADLGLFVIGATPAFSERVLGDRAAALCAGPIRVRLAPDSLHALEDACRGVEGAQDPAALESRMGALWQQAHALRRTTRPLHVITRRTLTSLYERPDLPRADVARMVRGHPTEVSRLFHDELGSTLSTFRARLRLLRFIDAVDGGAPSLLAAALGAGFGSYSQCHRVFRETLGCTPRAFFETTVRREMGEAFAPLAWATTSSRSG